MGKGGGYKNIADLGGDLLNITTQVATAGLVGYDTKTGKIKKGAVTHMLDEGVGEISGRNVQRKEAMKAEDRLREEQKKMDEELKAKQLQDYRADLQASRGAQGIRDTAVARSKAGVDGGKTKEVLGDEEDILGT